MKQIKGIKGIGQLDDLGYYAESNQLVLFQKLTKSGDITLFQLFRLKPLKYLYYFIVKFNSPFLFHIIDSPNGDFKGIDLNFSILNHTSLNRKRRIRAGDSKRSPIKPYFRKMGAGRATGSVRLGILA